MVRILNPAENERAAVFQSSLAAPALYETRHTVPSAQICSIIRSCFSPLHPQALLSRSDEFTKSSQDELHEAIVVSIEIEC